MATIKSYTDLQQSKKLAEILPLKSADNVIVLFGDREGTKTVVMPKETFDVIRTPFADVRNVTPCWSLASLLAVLPETDLIQNQEGLWMLRIWDKRKFPWSDGNYINPIDACYEMILKLHKLNLL